MALLPDQKFSTFQDGGTLEVGDIVVGLRDGLNTRFDYTGELPPGYVVPIVQGGTGATTAGGARTNLGLGTMAIQDADSVAITGGTAALASGSVTAAPTSDTDLANKKYVDDLDDGNVKSVSGTANEVDVDNSDPANPIVGLSDTIDAPGTFTIQGSSVINEIINDDTMATAGTDNISTSLAIKNYVDNLAEGLTVKAAVETASTSDFDATYDNGASGVGATLTANSNGAFSQDGEAGELDKSYLFKDQADAFENGVYVLTQVGDGSNPAILTRRVDFDQPDNIVRGSLVPVITGDDNGGTEWVQTSDVDTVGTDSIDFTLWMINVNRIVTTDTAQTITGAKVMDDLTLGGSQDAGSNFIINLLDPVNPQDAATKNYVDSQVGESGGLQSIQVFTSNGTWNKPAGINKIYVEVLGAGGGGGGATTDATIGGGGGSGGYGKKLIDVSAIASESVTVGAGGGSSSDGGTSSFGTHVTATGGVGGLTNGGSFASGGVASGGDVNGFGEHGGYGGEVGNALFSQSSLGGNTLYGEGGTRGSLNQNGSSGRGFSAGGGGGYRGSTTDRDGGNGAPGLVIVYEYT